MRSKDTPRLNVLRAIISEVNNASKTSNPVTNNMQVLTMLKKRKTASKAAAAEAVEAKRQDLRQKQESEIAILDEYAGQVDVMSEEETAQAVDAIIESLKLKGEKVNPGAVLRDLRQKEVTERGKAVESAVVAKLVQQRQKAI